MRKAIIITGICVIILMVAWLQFYHNSAPGDPRGTAYAGSAACVKCHSGIYNSYVHTAHYMASAPGNGNTVHGNFAKGFNVFDINKTQKAVMEKLDSGLFQTYYQNGKVKERHRFDIVFGAVKGETYLYWQGNKLFQLPLSYFSAQHQWSTSPGLGSNFMDYPQARSIGIRCMECHTSYINYLPGKAQELSGTEEFDKTSLIYSIDCERCHGPGAQHADFQSSNPQVKTARFITGYKSLTRSQKLDMCAVCHSGKPEVMLRSSFEFVPGDTFAKFKLPDFVKKIDTTQLDVHGNQVQLLQSSKCYINSSMDCSTCHNVHQNSRGESALYTQKCLSCHNSPNHTYCKMAGQLSAVVLKRNCISCHMPALTTKAISVQVAGKMAPVNFFVHTHRIAIYPQQAKTIMAHVN